MSSVCGVPVSDVPDGYANNLVQGAEFLTPKRYTLIETIGQGTYGLVCAARDDQGGSDAVAIKKFENAFRDLHYAKDILRELKILRHVRHENIIDVRFVFLPGDKESFEDIYVVGDLMETDLASILRSSQSLTEDHCEFFLYQILRGLKYVHSADIVHGHLKPRNLLVNCRCDLKICDFISATIPSPDKEYSMCSAAECFFTRWYQAPEILCSWAQICKSADVWSVGCVFAEILRRRPLFPGTNLQSQFQLMVNILGKPGWEVLRRIPHEGFKKFIEWLPAPTVKPLGEHVHAASALAVSFLETTLKFNPDERPTVGTCLEHPYLAQFYCPEDEPETEPIEVTQFEFERKEMDVAEIRQEMYSESLHYKAPL